MQTEITQLVDDFESGRLNRRQLVTHLTALAATFAAVPALGQEAASTFQAIEVDHVALRVTDLDRSRRFYENHLGLQVTDCSPQSCFLSCGRDFLALFRSSTAGLDHFAFSIDGYSASAAVEKLEAAGLKAKRHGNRVYFDDPDGLEVQVTAGG